MHLVLLLFLFFNRQPAQAGDVVIPMPNRPPNFSGAAGAYSIEMHTEPAPAHGNDPIHLRVEDAITLTVRIISQQPGPWRYPPLRDKLLLFPAGLDADFFIEALPELDQAFKSEKVWEFSWRLLPKHSGVKSIPAVEFVYYNTGDTPGFKAADGARSIALDVQPRPGLLLNAPPEAMAKFSDIVLGQGVLTRSWSGREGLSILTWGLALPPGLCFLIYVSWRRLFPDAAERLRRRRSKGLQAALKQLRKLNTSATPAQVRLIVADYLRLHIDLPQGGPTPREVKHALLARGLGTDVVSRTESFVRSCDAALFAPTPLVPAEELQGGAKELVKHLETELCASAAR